MGDRNVHNHRGGLFGRVVIEKGTRGLEAGHVFLQVSALNARTRPRGSLCTARNGVLLFF